MHQNAEALSVDSDDLVKKLPVVNDEACFELFKDAEDFMKAEIDFFDGYTNRINSL